MQANRIVIVTASNEPYFQGLCVTLMSAAFSSSRSIPIRIYVLDTGLSLENQAALLDLMSSLRDDCQIIFRKVQDHCFGGMRPDYGGGHSTYARLLISSLVPEDRAIYIDADFLVLRDLSEIWDRKIAPNLMLATPDLCSTSGERKKLSVDCPFISSAEADAYLYYNGGFLMIDLEAWRRENVEEQAFRCVKGYEDKLQAWDQTLLNFVLRGRIGPLPGFWNQSCSADGIPGDANIHYITMRKPWNHWSPIPMYRAWYAFHRRFIRPRLPLQLGMRGHITGVFRHFRDCLLASIPLMRKRYISRLQKHPNPRVAPAYENHLRKLSAAMTNPAWRSKKAIRDLEKNWS